MQKDEMFFGNASNETILYVESYLKEEITVCEKTEGL